MWLDAGETIIVFVLVLVLTPWVMYVVLPAAIHWLEVIVGVFSLASRGNPDRFPNDQ